MQLTREGATFTQNNQNFYVGNIESNDTIMIKDDFIIIGSIKSQKNIIAAEGLVVMGDITSKSIYVYRDLLCTGKIKAPDIEVEGSLRELCNSSLKTNQSLEVENTRIERESKDESINIVEALSEKEARKEVLTIIGSKEDKTEVELKSNVLKEREDIKLYDKVRHRVYGTGIITNLTTKGVYIEFNSGEVKRLDLNKVLSQGLLKRDVDYKINNIPECEDYTEKVSLGEVKEETNKSSVDNCNIHKNKVDKSKSRECISPAKERLKKSNIVTNLEKVRVGSVVLHETLGEGTIEEFNARRIKVNFVESGASSLDTKLVLKLKVMKVKTY